MKAKFASVIAIATLAILPTIASSAEFRQVTSGTDRQLVIEGDIESGDFQKFLDAIKEKQGQISTVWVFSPGGDFEEAMKIGRAMRALELASMVPTRNPFGKPQCDSEVARPSDPANCIAASAGFMIHIGGVWRGGSHIIVHRPYFEPKNFRQLSEAQAQIKFVALQAEARSYMSEMGVPEQIQERVVATPSDGQFVLDEATVKTYFSGDLPARHEWLVARCSGMSDSDRMKLDQLRNRLSNEFGGVFTSRDEAEFKRLDQLDLQEASCRIPLTESSRIAAFEKYFQLKANERVEQQFGAWVSAANDLGLEFADMIEKNGFVEKSFPDANRLERAATAHSPMVMEFDAPQAVGVVSKISVFSPPSPSKLYENQLLDTLNKSWGASKSPDGLQMVWKREAFVATLSHQRSSEDESLVLQIEKN
ncbi:MAG TPA: hypothetical protein VK660_02210 [Xanthomonadaceae bacterium]|jgi:hypothetical protein|nr:hypothetical protein [Xanthomonadaceae bacterium]